MTDLLQPPPESPEELQVEEEKAARSSLRYVLRFLLVLAVVASIGGALITTIGHFPHVTWHFRPGWLALALAAFATLQLVHAGLWRRIVRDLHGELEPFRSRAIWSASNLAKYVPTSLLLFVTRVAMAEKAGVPRRVTAASLVYELPLTVAGATIVGAYGAIQLPDLRHLPERWLVVLLPVIVLVVLSPRVFRPLADKALARGGREPIPETLSLPTVTGLAFVYAASFVLGGLGTYCFAQCLHTVGTGDLPTVVASFAIGVALSYVGFILPAGLGAREAGFTAALAPALPTAIALAVAVGVRLVQMALEVFYGLVTPALATRRERRRRGAAR